MQNESSFRVFVPNSASNFALNFPNFFFLSFRALSCGKRRPEKIHQKSLPFFKAKFSGKFKFSIFPVLPFLVFLEFLVFFPCEEFLVFLSVFPFFSRDFGGSVGIKNPCFFWWFSLPFPRKQGKEGQGLGLEKRVSNFSLYVASESPFLESLVAPSTG